MDGDLTCNCRIRRRARRFTPGAARSPSFVGLRGHRCRIKRIGRALLVAATQHGRSVTAIRWTTRQADPASGQSTEDSSIDALRCSPCQNLPCDPARAALPEIPASRGMRTADLEHLSRFGPSEREHLSKQRSSPGARDGFKPMARREGLLGPLPGQDKQRVLRSSSAVRVRQGTRHLFSSTR